MEHSHSRWVILKSYSPVIGRTWKFKSFCLWFSKIWGGGAASLPKDTVKAPVQVPIKIDSENLRQLKCCATYMMWNWMKSSKLIALGKEWPENSNPYAFDFQILRASLPKKIVHANYPLPFPVCMKIKDDTRYSFLEMVWHSHD